MAKMNEEKPDDSSDKETDSKSETNSSKQDAASKQSDEDDEDDDDEDDDEDEDDEDDEDDDEEEEEEESPKPPKKAQTSKKSSSLTKAKESKTKKPKPIVKLPSELPLPPRNTEILTGLVLAIAGYLAFWFGWSVYSTSIEKRHVSYFSNSAWAFLIAYFLIILASLYFVRRERQELPKKTTKVESPYRVDDSKEPQLPKPRMDRMGMLLATIICGPFYVVYWWKGFDIWKAMYATDRPLMWIIYGVALVVMSLGLFHGLRPPTPQEELERRIPSRRIILLLMSPFALVYGMIYLAGLYPPWP